jgi:hypothetical protein
MRGIATSPTRWPRGAAAAYPAFRCRGGLSTTGTYAPGLDWKQCSPEGYVSAPVLSLLLRHGRLPRRCPRARAGRVLRRLPEPTVANRDLHGADAHVHIWSVNAWPGLALSRATCTRSGGSSSTAGVHPKPPMELPSFEALCESVQSRRLSSTLDLCAVSNLNLQMKFRATNSCKSLL